MDNALLKEIGLPIIYRTLCSNDAEKYKLIRLESLTVGDRRFFAADFESEKKRTMLEWKKACIETCDYAVVAAFIEENIVGTMSVERWDKDKSGVTAYYRAAYIQQNLRNSEIAGVLFGLLDDWSKKHGCQRAAFAIRADNTSWLERQRSFGAEIIDQSMMDYADGTKYLTYILARPLFSQHGKTKQLQA